MGIALNMAFYWGEKHWRKKFSRYCDNLNNFKVHKKWDGEYEIYLSFK